MKTYMKAYIKTDKYKEYKTNIQYKTRQVFSKRLQKCVKNYKQITHKKSLDILRCDISLFLKWLEYNFIDEMTFENHGLYWDINHIVPCNSFDLTNKDEICKCFHWSNLAPLKHIKNISKGSKILPDVIDYYNIRAELY